MAAAPPARRPDTREVLLRFLWLGVASFGAGRPAYLYNLVARMGWIEEPILLRDYALAQILPGSTFIGFTILTGLRLGGPPMGAAVAALVFLPGTIAIIAAMVLLPAADPRVAGLFHGVLIGSVGSFLAGYLRASRSGVASRADGVLATAALALTVAHVPLPFTLIVVFAGGLWWKRPRGTAAA